MLDELTSDQTAKVRNELESVISSAAFSGSKRCQDFLRLIVDRRLAGDLDSLRERMIGAKMFGRNVDYDTSNDAVVRVRATEVRKRLAQYYSENGRNPAVRLELPSGSYVPEFHWQSPESLQKAVTAAGTEQAIGSRSRPVHRTVILAGGIALVCALAFVSWYSRGRKPQPINPVRLSLGLPEGVNLQWSWHPLEHNALSPDGRTLAFVATNSSVQSALWVRSLDSSEAQQLDQTEGALLPFWSPDSQFIGFWAKGKLMKVRLTGGTPEVIYSVPEIAQGAWGPDGTILFARAVHSPIFRIAPDGKSVTPVNSLLPGQVSQMWVQVLPDGKHFIYLARTTLASSDPGAKIYVQSLDGGSSTPLLSTQSRALAAPDYLLFTQDQTLLAQRMDWNTLRKIGLPQILARKIAISPAYLGTSEFTASQNGVLVYGSGEGASFQQLNWCDRDGTHTGNIKTVADYQQFTLSPDEKHVALNSFHQHATGSLWLIDLASNTTTPLTTDPQAQYPRAQSDPVWSPDSRYVAFNLLPNGGSDPPFLVQEIEIASQQIEAVYGDDQRHWVEEWSPDGKFLLTHDTKTLSIIPLAGQIRPKAIYSTGFVKDEFHLSPDGRLIAFGENRTGRWEVYVAPFPSFQPIKQVSTAGGAQPRWRRDGRELFFLDPEGNMMSASVERDLLTRIGSPRKLFGTGLRPDPTVNQYAVTADGRKFLLLEPQKDYLQTYSVILNWPEALK
jgi:Tol biopolymer transport system component